MNHDIQIFQGIHGEKNEKLNQSIKYPNLSPTPVIH